jgi:hypothetical protein
MQQNAVSPDVVSQAAPARRPRRSDAEAYWQSALSEPVARSRNVPIQNRRLSEIPRRCGCRRRCDRIIEIQTTDAQRL